MRKQSLSVEKNGGTYPLVAWIPELIPTYTTIENPLVAMLIENRIGMFAAHIVHCCIYNIDELCYTRYSLILLTTINNVASTMVQWLIVFSFVYQSKNIAFCRLKTNCSNSFFITDLTCTIKYIF